MESVTRFRNGKLVYRLSEWRANFLGHYFQQLEPFSCVPDTVHLGLSLVLQVGQLVPDDPPMVNLGQANHLAAQDKVLYLVLGLRDQAQHIQVGQACEEGAENMVAWLKQEHMEGDDVGRNVGQFNRTLGREGVKHLQAILGSPDSVWLALTSLWRPQKKKVKQWCVVSGLWNESPQGVLEGPGSTRQPRS